MTAAAELTGLLQFGGRARIRGMAIDIDHQWRVADARQCQPQEHLRRDQVPLR